MGELAVIPPMPDLLQVAARLAVTDDDETSHQSCAMGGECRTQHGSVKRENEGHKKGRDVLASSLITHSSRLKTNWRRGWDSNPRDPRRACSLSRRVH